jgi:MFS family permease
MTARDHTRGGTVAIAALCSVQFADVLGVTVVVTALPRMLADLKAPASASSLVAGGYAMCFGGLLMLGARLGDRFGHRRTITASLAVFALGALLGAVADSAALLTAARCLQGAAAAASVPSALRLLTTLTADGPKRRRAIAVWSAAGASAGASGFVVGGIVTGLADWRWVFWTYVPLAAAIAAAVVRSVPRDHGPRPAVPLNAAAAAAFTAAVMAIVAGTTLIAQPGRQPAGLTVVLLAVPLTAAFLIADRRASAPLLPVAVLRTPPLRRGTAGAFLNTLATSSAMTLTTLYLQDTRHDSPLAAAATLVPFSLAVVAGSAVASPALHRIGCQRAMSAGLAAIAAADAALAVTAAHRWAVPACVAIAGAGLGLSSVASTALGTTVPAAQRGTASGIINTAAQLGTAIGIAAVMLIAAATTGLPGPGTSAPVIAWAAAGAIAITGALAFIRSSQPASAATRAADLVGRRRLHRDRRCRDGGTGRDQHHGVIARKRRAPSGAGTAAEYPAQQPSELRALRRRQRREQFILHAVQHAIKPLQVRRTLLRDRDDVAPPVSWVDHPLQEVPPGQFVDRRHHVAAVHPRAATKACLARRPEFCQRG